MIRKKPTKQAEQEILRVLAAILSSSKTKTKKEEKKKPDSDELKKENASLKKQTDNLENLLGQTKDAVRNFHQLVPDKAKFFFSEEKKANEEKISLRYQFKDDNFTYNVDFGYKNNDETQEAKISVTVKDEIDKTIGRYSIAIKENKVQKGYTVYLKHESKDSINEAYRVIETVYRAAEVILYSKLMSSYMDQFEEQRQDFTKALDKSLHIMPESFMGGVLGFTYLGENFMARRADLTGAKALMVDVHEAIHTPDEYETRVLTDWMLSRERRTYKK